MFASVADHPETARSLARTHGELRLLPVPDVARVAAASTVPADVVRMHHATTDLLSLHYYDQVDLLDVAARSAGRRQGLRFLPSSCTCLANPTRR